MKKNFQFHMTDGNKRYINIEVINSGKFYKNVLAICSNFMETDQQGLYIYPDIKPGVVGMDEI